MINFKEKLEKLTELWPLKIIAQMNANHLKLAKLKGDFVCHNHANTDETFIVLEGRILPIR